MDEHKLIETLFERYLNNQATDDELDVFLDLLKQGKLDDLIKVSMDREADLLTNIPTGRATAGVFQPWMQWLRIAASISFILW